MQLKTLASLLFATAAVAAPAGLDDFDDMDFDIDVPSSILAAAQTAIPTAWVQSLYKDPSFASSVYKDYQSGKYPDWYSSLPQELKDYATSDLPTGTAASSDIAAILSSATNLPSMSMIITGTHTGSMTSAPSGSASGSGSTPLSGAASTSTGESSSESGSPSGSGSGSGSASASGSGASSTATGGAPAATGIGMSLAGAAGVLGIAMAL